MKTLISIPLVLLILFSGINVKIASHFCGGNFASAKVSLSGELASCGMENKSEENPLLTVIGNHCCDDIVSSCSISTNYFPSFSSVTQPVATIIQLPFIIDDILLKQYVAFSTLAEIKRPPGISTCSIDPEVICIFRI